MRSPLLSFLTLISSIRFSIFTLPKNSYNNLPTPNLNIDNYPEKSALYYQAWDGQDLSQF